MHERLVRKLKESQRRFPADTSLEGITFLNNKKINGELYGMLQALAQSPFTGNGPSKADTIVYKKDLPTQAVMCEKLGIKSPKTIRAHFAQLIETGYVVEDEQRKCYILPEKEDMYLLVPLTTSQYLWDNCQEHVVKLYVYLGQRYKYVQSMGRRYYDFTLAELGEHLGIGVKNHAEAYRVIRNALLLLKNSGLIEYEEVYVDKVPHQRLSDFSFTVRNIDEVILDSQ